MFLVNFVKSGHPCLRHVPGCGPGGMAEATVAGGSDEAADDAGEAAAVAAAAGDAVAPSFTGGWSKVGKRVVPPK